MNRKNRSHAQSGLVRFFEFSLWPTDRSRLAVFISDFGVNLFALHEGGPRAQCVRAELVLFAGAAEGPEQPPLRRRPLKL
jgi:hypothetical protein